MTFEKERAELLDLATRLEFGDLMAADKLAKSLRRLVEGLDNVDAVAEAVPDTEHTRGKANGILACVCVLTGLPLKVIDPLPFSESFRAAIKRHDMRAGRTDITDVWHNEANNLDEALKRTAPVRESIGEQVTVQRMPSLSALTDKLASEGLRPVGPGFDPLKHDEKRETFAVGELVTHSHWLTGEPPARIVSFERGPVGIYARVDRQIQCAADIGHAKDDCWSVKGLRKA